MHLKQPMLERGETPQPNWRAQLTPEGEPEQKEPCNETIPQTTAASWCDTHLPELHAPPKGSWKL